MPQNLPIGKIYLNAPNLSTTQLMSESFEMQSLRSPTGGQSPQPRRMSDAPEDSLCSSFIGSLLIASMILLVLSTLPFSLYFCIIIIHDHEKAVLFRNGRLHQGNILTIILTSE